MILNVDLNDDQWLLLLLQLLLLLLQLILLRLLILKPLLPVQLYFRFCLTGLLYLSYFR